LWLPGLAAAVLTVLILPQAASGASESIPGQVAQVTLYRGQAVVTRVIPTEGPQGLREIVVGDLPEHVVAESLFAEGSEGIDVRAVRFRTRAVGEEPREEVRKLDEALTQATEKLEVNTKQQELFAKQTAYLDQLEGFTAATAKSDLARGVLDADSLRKVTLFSFEQRQSLADRAVALAKEAKALNEQIALLQRKRGEVTSGASRTVREALLFVEKRAEGAAPVRLSYLVSECDWQPAYTWRAAAGGKEVRVECNGLIHQMTGEDWSGVQLTLSTASPALAASGPGLAPFAVSLKQGGETEQRGPEDLTAQLDAIREQLNAALARHGEAAELGAKARLDWELNAAANAFQNLELLSGRDLVGTLRAGDAEAAQGPSLNFALTGPVSVASRSDQQMVQIFETGFEGRFYHVATPVLTRHVYREAELVNTGEQDLLAGPVSAYLDGRFVGRGELPTVARGQMFVASFGADPQLRARRELVDKTDSIQGGNRKLDFQYRLIVENYTPQALPVRVYDRLPYSGDATEIRVTLGDMKEPLSEDALYLRRQRSKGILRWEVTVPPCAVREKAHTIEYGFSVEFDRTFQLAPLGGSQEQAEFDRLRRFQAAPEAAAAEAPAPAPTPAPPDAP
jgi:hypothetical protein